MSALLDTTRVLDIRKTSSLNRNNHFPEGDIRRLGSGSRDAQELQTIRTFDNSDLQQQLLQQKLISNDKRNLIEGLVEMVNQY